MSPEVGIATRTAKGASRASAESRRVRRVLFVTNMYPTPRQPAFGIIVERLATALRRDGLEVEIECVSCGRGSSDYLLARRRIERVVRSYAPDLVHVHFGYTALATAADYPRVVSFYGDDLNGESIGRGARITLKSRIGVVISRWAARRCERSIAVSEALRSRLLNADARERCIVIRDSVDAEIFSPGSRLEARQRLNLRPDAELVLFPHSLHQRTKRIDLARAAVERLKSRRPNAELWIVNGRSPEEMPDVYRAANVLIVTSDLEGGPSCVKEALACGLPVVSVPVGDVRVLEETPEASIIASRDPEELGRALEKAFYKPEGRASRLPPALTLRASISRIREVYEAAWRDHQAKSRARDAEVA